MRPIAASMNLSLFFLILMSFKADFDWIRLVTAIEDHKFASSFHSFSLE